MKQVKKADLVNILVEQYGYEKEDLKFNSEGKPFTNAQLQELIKTEEEDAERAKFESTRKVAQKSKKFKPNDLITIMSGIQAVEYYSSRSNMKWHFERFGQQDVMEYSELITMNNSHPSYLKEGYFIVLDKDVQDELKLTEMYENIITPENIDSVFEMDVEELDKFVEALPKGQKQMLVSRASELFAQDKINKYSTIKYFENKFDFSFNDNAPLGDVVAQAETTGVNNLIIVDKY